MKHIVTTRNNQKQNNFRHPLLYFLERMMFRWNYLIFKDLCKFFKLWLLIYGAKNEPFKASFRKNPKNHEFGKIPQKPLFCWFSGFSPFYPKIPLFLTPLKIPLKYPLFLTPLKNPHFRNNSPFFEKLKNTIFSKIWFFKNWRNPKFQVFSFFKKMVFLPVLLVLSVFSFF